MAISYFQFQDVADQLEIETATVQAISKVESNGGGFLADGRPKILFEGHVFWKRLSINGINPNDHVKGNEDILYEKWDKSKYLGGIKEYDRLEKAKKIHYQAALESASYGAFQIMGFNYALCGFSSVESFVKAMSDEASQLKAFATFLKSRGLSKHLKEKNWQGFAREYNGPAFKDNNYDSKLKNAYDKAIETEKKIKEQILQDFRLA